MTNPSEPDSPASELDLDLQFLPAWARKPASENRFARFEGRGGEDRPQRGDRRDSPWQRGGPRPGGGGPRREGGRPPGDRRPGPPGDRGPARRPEGEQRFGRPRPEEQPKAPDIELNISLIPEERGVESLARQIKLTGRAYPLFDIGSLILKRPERYNVQFSVVKSPEGKPLQPLFVCNLDDSLWLSETEAVNHVLTKHFGTFYQEERIPTDPPKGTYTFVAQCGISGVVLGPPNYHDYQNKLRKLHQERFSRMAFEMFKSRVKIVKDEAVVKKWIDEQSFKNEYIALNMPEPLRLPNREAVEKHFREVHLPNIIQPTESHTMTGAAAAQQPSMTLRTLYRRNVEDQARFPLRLVNVLSQQFATHGLQFFKVNKTITHVAVARPRFLDVELTPVSEGVRKIIDFIYATPKCTRRKLVEALAPTPRPAPAPAAQAPEAAPVENAGAPSEPPSQTAAAAPAEVPPTPEAEALIRDLHWLIHQGHVIEFSSGLLEMAKRPIIKPQPQKPKVVEQKPAPAASEAPKEAPAEQPAPAAEDTATAPETAATVESPSEAVEASEEVASAATPEPAAEVTAPVESSEAPGPAAPDAEPPRDRETQSEAVV